MSITVETAKEHLNDKAVFCCRAEEGIVISPENLEDPGLFDDLVDSGLLSFPDDALTIGQVLGAKLLKTTDALIPITPGIIDAVQGGEEKVEEKEEVVEAPVAEVSAPVAPVAPVTPVAQTQTPAGVLKLQIGKGENINLEIPLAAIGEYGVLSMVSEGGGYGIPVNFVWDGKNSAYIHCAPEGRKLEAIKANNKVSLCIIGNVNLLPGKFTTEYESAIFFGTAHTQLSDEEKMDALHLLIDKLSSDFKEIGDVYAHKSFHRVEIIRIDFTEFSGKRKKVPLAAQQVRTGD